MKPFEQDSTGSGYLMMSIGIKLLFACLTTMTEVTTLASAFTEQLQAEWEHQYRTLEQDMGRRDQCASYAHQTAHPSSLILDSDRDPVDIVLRRTSSLLQDIQSMSGKHRLDRLETSLDRLRTRGTETVPRDGNARFELFVEICSLRRTIALSNPLLNFNKLLFIKRHRASFNHMCDQYYGVNAVSGGGIFVLENPWGNHPRATNLLADTTVQRGRLKGRKLTEGSFLSPDLSYDGTRIVFAYV